ncbi:MAG: T9SS type A sorting domain-containing protein [Bacteroidales bacterium]|nr:T9SS type A sorting domain-containing protein [Bacteroidales bacterium]
MNKLTVLLAILILITIEIKSQIPNEGFENWITIGNYEDPIGWATMNTLCTGPFYSCTKSTDHYPVTIGNYSIRLENNTSLTQMTGGYGMAITDTMAYPFEPAFPITANETSLCGYYKYNSFNDDSMYIRLVFFKNGLMIGNNTFVTGTTTSTWTPFTLPLTYPTADSATLFLSAFYPNSQLDGPNGNSVLLVDNLSFNNLVFAETHYTQEKELIRIYPNPSSDFVYIETEETNFSNQILNIYNGIGELIITEKLLQNQQQIDVKMLSNGVYVFEFISEIGTEKQKLIIQR